MSKVLTANEDKCLSAWMHVTADQEKNITNERLIKYELSLSSCVPTLACKPCKIMRKKVKNIIYKQIGNWNKWLAKTGM